VGAFGFAMPSGTSVTNISVSVVGPGTLIRCLVGNMVNANVRAFVGLAGVAVASTVDSRNISVTVSGARTVFDNEAPTFVTSSAYAHVGGVGVAVYNTSFVAGVNITVKGTAVAVVPSALQSSATAAVGGVALPPTGLP
jgi:hypothetical protein